MRTQFKLLTVMLLIVLLSVAGCTSAASQPVVMPEAAEVPTEMTTDVSEPTAPSTGSGQVVPEPTVDQAATVVMDMIARTNAEDYAGAAELVADDMMAYFIGMPPTGMEIYWGKEQFQTFLEECCTGQNFVWEVVPEQVEDGVVYAESKTWMDFTRELGVAPNSWHEIFVVKDGKITLYVSMITEEALANFKPAIFEAIPELATAIQPPIVTDEAPATEVAITIANSTCAYDGPMTLQAGELPVNVDVQDQNWEKYAVSFFTLDEGKDMLDLMASTYRDGPPSWSNMVFLKELNPNESQTFNNFNVKEGLLYMVCWAGSPDIPIGNAGPFVVKP
jgi:ketosteroid isomerase-like protein/predicted small lipoprotein YifL